MNSSDPLVLPPPTWYALSHHDRYRKLDIVRRRWGRYNYGKKADCGDRIIHLNGAWINDIPSFYLALGEAINGPNGYFGGDLDALSDCLCGSFGVVPPLTIRLSHFDAVRNALDGCAWCRFRAESFQQAVRAGESTECLVDWGYFDDGSEADIARRTAIYEAALTGKPFDCDAFGSYFDAILAVVKRHGSALTPMLEPGSDGPHTVDSYP